MESRARVFVGLTGASGHAYCRGLIRALAGSGYGVDLAVTEAGTKVLRHEEGIQAAADGRIAAEDLEAWLGPEAAAQVTVWGNDEVGAPAASGTALGRAVILCPCSMGTLARVAAGFSSNLVERAADVALKEGRALAVVFRETPLSELHLENLLRIARLGAVVLPAAPGFYHRPRTIDDLVEHLVAKVLHRLDLRGPGRVAWGGLAAPAEPTAEPGTEPPASSGPQEAAR